jgi:hypothetical protein
MSLYNALFGISPAATFFLEILGADLDKVPRFRDCFLSGDRICIHTRTGGGNRDAYTEGIHYLTTLAGYERNEDASYDQTFANFYYAIPPQVKDIVEAIREKVPDCERDPEKMWRSLNQKLESGERADPMVERALKVGEKIFAQIKAAIGGKERD